MGIRVTARLRPAGVPAVVLGRRAANQGLLQERLGLAGEIETIHFNSFTFFAQVEGLVIRQADGAPLLQLGLLQVNF